MQTEHGKTSKAIAINNSPHLALSSIIWMRIYYYTSALLSAYSSQSTRYSSIRKQQLLCLLLYYWVTRSHSIISSSFAQNTELVSHIGFTSLCLTSYTCCQQQYTSFLSISREDSSSPLKNNKDKLWEYFLFLFSGQSLL